MKKEKQAMLLTAFLRAKRVLGRNHPYILKWKEHLEQRLCKKEVRLSL